MAYRGGTLTIRFVFSCVFGGSALFTLQRKRSLLTGSVHKMVLDQGSVGLLAAKRPQVRSDWQGVEEGGGVHRHLT